MNKPIELSEAAQQARNEYYRKWRAANPDKVKLYNARYWDKKFKEQQAENSSMTAKG